MSCSCRKYAAWLSRSAKMATSTLAPVTSSRPDDCTWITARWMTRWNPAVGLESSAPSVTRLSSSDSMYASSRCSSVAYSWCLSLASASARWSDCSRLREKVGIMASSFLRPSFLLHHALQRMLVLAGEVHDLRHLGLGDLVSIHAAFADSVVVNVKHDSCGRIAVLVEEALQHVHYELHRRVVVIEQEHSVHIGPLDLRPGLGDDRASRRAGQARIAAAALAIIVSHPGLQACRPNFVLVHGQVGRPSHRSVRYRHRSGMSTAQGIMPHGGTKRNAKRNNRHGRRTVPESAELDLADVPIRLQCHRGP